MSTEVTHALAVAIQMGLPVLLWGDPGEGKTSVIQSIAAKLDRPCEVVIGSLREASDFAGLPVRDEDGVRFAPPSWARRCIDAPTTVVFLDELTTADHSVQAAMLRVVHERVVGDLQLPDSVSIVAAANPPESAVGGNDLSAPLANRFLHLRWEAGVGSWLEGMTSGWSTPDLPVLPVRWSGIELQWRCRVAEFIRVRPDALRAMPASIEGQGGAWPSPRSWEMAALAAAAAEAAGASTEVLAMMVKGLVGPGAAMEMLQFSRRSEMQDPEMILADPAAFDASGRSDLVLAVLRSVIAMVADDLTEERWLAGWEVVAIVAERDRRDVAALGAMDLLKLRRMGWTVPEIVRGFGSLLREVGAA